MKILITGAAGFIGSSLTDAMLALGHDVVGIDSFEDYYARDLKDENLASALTSPSFRLVEANILDLARPDAAEKLGVSLDSLVADADRIYHLAAQPGVRGSWGSSFSIYTDNNVLATQMMLESAKQQGVEQFVYASSSSVYGDTDVFPMREDALCRPFSPYGVTKYAAENLCQLYWRNFGVPTVAFRFFTVYGPRQRPDMAFNLFISALLEGRKIKVYGDGAQTRDFTFISDIIEGLVAAPAAPNGSILNLGGGSRVTLSYALDVLGEVVGHPLDVDLAEKQAGDVLDTWASIEQTRDAIGYQPHVALREGLTAEYEWLLARNGRGPQHPGLGPLA